MSTIKSKVEIGREKSLELAVWMVRHASADDLVVSMFSARTGS
ncbi:hypothetical protein ABIF97_004069 [Bradyrhizobium japonicum]